MVITSKTTVREASILLHGRDFLSAIEYVPVSLPELTYGQRIDLSEMQTIEDAIFLSYKILKGYDREKVLNLSFVPAYRFGLSVMKELERMAKRDDDAFRYNPSPDEIAAGYNSIDHGVFGTVDRIALRLGIKHEDVFNLPEKRVFAMLKIDFDNSMYNKRLNEIISKKK